MRFSTWLSPLALAAFLAVAPPSHAQAAPSAPLPPVATAVQNVQNFYNSSQTFQSDFQQQFTAKAYNETKTSQGHVTFAKPGKMNWVYANPQGNRVVSDGVTLWAYTPSNAQVIQQKVQGTQYPAVLSFLTGQGNLTQTFTFQIFDGAQMNFPGGYVLVGTPIQPNPSVVKVLFYVDQASSQMRRTMVIDAQGNRNRFDFTNPQVNLPVSPAQFTFKAPAGTTVVDPANAVKP